MTVGIIGPGNLRFAVEARITMWANNMKEDRKLEEPSRVARTLRETEESRERCRGWLDLNNGILFFADLDVFKKTCESFGIDGAEDGE